MQITNFFFLKRSFLNYDRFLVATAAMFLAGKIFNENKRIESFSSNYLKAKTQFLFGGGMIKPLSEDEIKATSSKLCRLECLILKTMIDHSG
jgi:hypothetical protein